MPSVADPARVADRIKFLSRVAPFQSLSEEELREVAGRCASAPWPPGRRSSSRAGRPGRSCTSCAWARSSSSTRTPMWRSSRPARSSGTRRCSPAWRPSSPCARARTRCVYCFPREAAMALLTHPAGVTWMAANARERLLQAAGTMRALPDVRTLPVTSVTRSKPLFCDPATTAQEAAEIMIAEKRSAILVRGPGGKGIQGIVTDVDLRNKVVVGHVLAARAGHRDHVGAGPHHRRRGARSRGEHRHDGLGREPHAGARQRRRGGRHPLRQQPDDARVAEPLRAASRDHGGAHRGRA